jgi:Ca-activated chloride channel homolog
MEIAFPIALLCPLLFALSFFRRKNNPIGIPHPQVVNFQTIPKSIKLKLRKPILYLLAFLTICSLTFAAIRPQLISNELPPEFARNLILTLDLSGSMNEPDFQTPYGRTSRLEGVKSVVAEFIKGRPKDKIGVVVFGTTALLQSPLTLDHELLIEMIKQLQVGLAGKDTAIGDGLGLSLKRIKDIEGQSKAIILLTDGSNHAGSVNPIKAAHIAKDLGIKIHTIGVGSNGPTGRGIMFPFQSGQVEFDEETLKKIAEITGGTYFNASSLEGLKEVYLEIDKLETTKSDDINKRNTRELYPFLAIVGASIYLTLLLFSRGILLRLPC